MKQGFGSVDVLLTRETTTGHLRSDHLEPSNDPGQDRTFQRPSELEVSRETIFL